MWMLDVYAEAQLFEYAAFGLDHLILRLVVVLVDGHGLNEFARAHLFNVVKHVHDIAYAFRTFFDFAAQKYRCHGVILLKK